MRGRGKEGRGLSSEKLEKSNCRNYSRHKQNQVGKQKRGVFFIIFLQQKLRMRGEPPVAILQVSSRPGFNEVPFSDAQVGFQKSSEGLLVSMCQMLLANRLPLST